jgi:uncharacterized membrane protein
MRDAGFIKRLEKALPEWAKSGFLSADAARDILAFEKERAGGAIPYLTLALAILGVLLLGSGIISFFAANWQWLPKIAKLAVLFGGMWAAYAIAGFMLGRGAHPLVGQAVLLLGVLLFGANIWLIAQIYHISSHYPNGVLIWALGALLASYLLRSHPALCAAALLAILWTGMEGFGFNRPVHWPYLLFWVACVPPVIEHRWRFAAHAAAAGILFWSWSTVFHIEWAARGAMLYLAQLYFLVYLAAFLAGMLMERAANAADLAGLVKRYAGIAALAALFVLTFPELHKETGWWHTGNDVEPAQTRTWAIATLIALLMVVALAWHHRRVDMGTEGRTHLDWGWGLLAMLTALIFVNLFARGAYPQAVPILFNLLFFGGLVWLIYVGIAAHDRGLVNLAFAFFALGILARYLDTFWTLLGRSYFFMGGGMVLIVAGIVLERSRRRITRVLEGGVK